VKRYLEIIADRLSKAGFSLGWVSAIDSKGRTIWIVDAHRDDGRRFAVHADEKLTAFRELKSANLRSRRIGLTNRRDFGQTQRRKTDPKLGGGLSPARFPRRFRQPQNQRGGEIERNPHESLD